MIFWFIAMAVIMCFNTALVSHIAYTDKNWKYAVIAIIFGLTVVGFIYVGLYYDWIGPAYKYVGVM